MQPQPSAFLQATQGMMPVQPHQGIYPLAQQESLLQQTTKGKFPIQSSLEGSLGMKEEEVVDCKDWSTDNYNHNYPLASMLKYVPQNNHQFTIMHSKTDEFHHRLGPSN
jgi:hypothetical protein